MWCDRYVHTLVFWLEVFWSKRFAATLMYACIAYTGNRITDLMCWCVTSSWVSPKSFHLVVSPKSFHPVVTKLMQLVTE